MNFMNNLQNLADQAQDAANNAANLAVPMELQNLTKTHEAAKQKLEQIKQNIANGNLAVGDQITHLRTLLQTHYGHLMRGGDPEPVPGGKMHPAYLQAKNGYAELDTALSELEKNTNKCTFGYQLSDGRIVKPSLDWSEAQWLEIKNSAKDQVARCWLDQDKNQYI